MNTNRRMRGFAIRFSTVACAAIAMTACGLNKQSAPELSGPSELAQSLTLTASPDHLLQDGQAQSVVTATLRDAAGNPMPGIGLVWSVSASDNSPVERPDVSSVTDANGRAATTVTAPPPPSALPTRPVTLTVSATPMGNNSVNALARSVELTLVPPVGTPAANNNPVAAIVADRVVAEIMDTIHFDGSTSNDEGRPCDGTCQFTWEFGDNTTITKGVTATHQYELPGTYIVTLSVTDDRGGVGTKTVSIRIIGPTAPIASFTSTPTTVLAGNPVTFNGAASSVGLGASVTKYMWDFGDGTVYEGGATTTTHTFAVAGTYSVTLTVSDNFGRVSAPMMSTVTVQ